jgi:4-hydroxy-3-methylbut-2-en-1-yl diphosphate reductase
VTAPLVCTPLWVEYLALRGKVSGGQLARTGMGQQRSMTSARRLCPGRPGVLVAGVAGSLRGDVRSGDVVVATEVWRADAGSIICPHSVLLVEALRASGLTVHEGVIVTTAKLERRPALSRLTEAGVLAVDMESYDILSAATSHEVAVVRVIVDTPDNPLVRAGTIVRGTRALRALRATAPAIQAWATRVASRHVSHPTTEEVI